MATKTFCDGCSTECADGEVTTVGRYDPCVYCPECAKAWRKYEEQEHALRVEMVRSFETKRAALRASMTSEQRLARLPDEG